MSRIDEALKQSAPRPVPAGSQPEIAAPRTVPTDSLLEHYPVEGRTRVGDFAGPGQGRRSSGRVEREQGSESALVADEEFQSKLVVSALSPAVYTEQYRRLAGAMHELQAERAIKSLLITSALPREGKTLTVTNLALTLSESYKRRVLLIDADLRRPTIDRLLQLPATKGLSEALRAGDEELPIRRVSASLSVVVAGRPDRNPMASLTSERLRRLLTKAATDYDWVLIDTPPVGILPDAGILAGLADGILLVVAAGVTPYHLAQRAVLDLGRELIVGTLMNRIEPHRIPASSYYHHYSSDPV